MNHPLHLTPREMEILSLAVRGYQPKRLAEMLGTTHQNVKNLLRRVYDKLGAGDRLELITMAAAQGALTLLTCNDVTYRPELYHQDGPQMAKIRREIRFKEDAA